MFDPGYPGKGRANEEEEIMSDSVSPSNSVSPSDGVSPQDNPEKDPADWVTGDDPATGPQKSYLQTLAREAGREVETDGMSKAGASRLIDELQAVSGRGTSAS